MSRAPRKQTRETSDQDVRPIGARALKSLIDTLRPRLQNALCLDLFAGQGRIGLAALEAGARGICFVEKNLGRAKTLTRETEKRFAGGETRVLAQDALRYLGTAAQTYDVIFADPPFPLWNAKFERELVTGLPRVLQPNGWVVIKYPVRRELPAIPTRLTLRRAVSFGESKLLYLTHAPSGGESPKSEHEE